MAVEIPAAAYAEGDAFQAEKRTVFSREWLPVAHASQLPDAGDFVSNSVGGWPVFAVRDADGAVRTFRNVCRHQNMQVVEKPGGKCTEFRCRYHGWTYDTQGRFVTAPPPVAPADPASPDNHLRALATSLVGGLVLFSLHDSPPAATLGEAGDRIAATVGGSPRHAGAITTEIGCNWKTCLEHALASGSPAWSWPLVLARECEGGLVVEQVVPRTFLRTRVVRHYLVRDPHAGSLPASLQAEAEASKAACEALQAARADGVPASATGRVGELHERLARAYAADPGA